MALLWLHYTTKRKTFTGSVDSSTLAESAVGIIRLNEAETTDVKNGSSLTANTWTDVIANKDFTVDNSNSTILISFSGCLQVVTSVSGGWASTRCVIDSGGTPQNLKLGGAPNIGTAVNPLTGAGTLSITGLSAGTHTIKLQTIFGASGASIYLRAATQSNQEFLTTTVVELKR